MFKVSNTNIVITLGVLVLLLPMLGIPQSVDNVLYFIFGAVIAGLTLYEKVESRKNQPKRKTSTFEENGVYETEKEPIDYEGGNTEV